MAGDLGGAEVIEDAQEPGAARPRAQDRQAAEERSHELVDADGVFLRGALDPASPTRLEIVSHQDLPPTGSQSVHHTVASGRAQERPEQGGRRGARVPLLQVEPGDQI